MKTLVHISCPYGRSPGRYNPKTWCGLDIRSGHLNVIPDGGNRKTKMNQLILRSPKFELAPCEACKSKADSPISNLFILGDIDL